MTQRPKGSAPRRQSLRWRLVIGILALMACGLAISDVAGVLLLRAYLLQRVDQQLSVPQLALPTQVPGVSVPVRPCSSRTTSDGYLQLPTGVTITVFDRAGALECTLPRDRSTADAPALGTLTAAQLAEEAGTGQISSVPGLATGSAWRIRILASQDSYIVLAISLTDAIATVRRLSLVALSTSVIILALTAVGGLALVRVGLRPLSDIEATAVAIAGGDLSRRVSPAPPETEVGRLSVALNSMLTQIEQGFIARAETEERLRRFVADASHELRTPLSTIRGHAELFRQGVASSPEDVSRLMNRIESESIRMGGLVDDLLLLARFDASRTVARDPVDLLSLAADAVVDARALDPGRLIVLARRSDPPWLDAAPVVDGEEARLRQVLANLLSNTVRHTPAGTPVEVEVGVLDGIVELSVIDHGPGIPPEAAAHVFQRFYRGDAGRSRDKGGAGLGLSIVATLVAAHDGSIRLQQTPGGGSTFIVDLPRVVNG